MKNSLTDIEQQVVDIIKQHRGKARAIPGRELATHLFGSWTVATNGYLGRLVHNLRLKGYPIIGIRNQKPGGYFWIDSHRELEIFLSRYENEIGTMRQVMQSVSTGFARERVEAKRKIAA